MNNLKIWYYPTYKRCHHVTLILRNKATALNSHGKTGRYGTMPIMAQYDYRNIGYRALEALLLCKKQAYPIYLHSYFHQTQEQPGNSYEHLLWGLLRSVFRVQMNEGTCKKGKRTDEEGRKSICTLCKERCTISSSKCFVNADKERLLASNSHH